ncbi:MAG: hypothetical protein QG608_300 [Actinomycetota bacterium]|nr:hypothetical protein [Actinomycetota bacterium]
MRMKPRVALVAALTAGLALPGAAAATAMTHPSRSGTQRTATNSDTTSALEADRSAAVKTPTLDWWRCATGMHCASVDVPLDYDSPTGKTTEIAVVRIPAKNPGNKIGTLFIGPEKAGWSGIEMALNSSDNINDDLLKQFDIVGFDPRGVGYSDTLECFASAKDQKRALSGIRIKDFPFTSSEEEKATASAKALGTACATRSKDLASSMSTAQTARDMDLLRRAVGEDKLTYFGYSYGSELGLTYANMYPDRVRAVALDAVVDPVAWAGSSATASTPLSARLKNDEAADKALQEILSRCDATTTKICPLAGRAFTTFEAITQRLKKGPLTFTEDDGTTWTYSYPHFIQTILGDLNGPFVDSYVTDTLLHAETLISRDTPAKTQASAMKSLLAKEKERDVELRSRTAARKLTGWSTSSVSTHGFPYDNSEETYAGVVCTDGVHPEELASWPRTVAALDEHVPHFGRALGWDTARCASDTWTLQDEDAYRGPFNRRTANPVLIVGNYWDPTTPYTTVRSTADRMPNARLLPNDGWGRTTFHTSLCATEAVTAYLLKQTPPAEGLTCADDKQPFTEDFYPEETDPSRG